MERIVIVGAKGRCTKTNSTVSFIKKRHGLTPSLPSFAVFPVVLRFVVGVLHLIFCTKKITNF